MLPNGNSGYNHMNGYGSGYSSFHNHSGMAYPSQYQNAQHGNMRTGETSLNPRLHQNAEAVARNFSKDKTKLVEGKNAAAIDQLHENDLHGIQQFPRADDKHTKNPRQEFMERKGRIGLHLRPRIKQDPGYEGTELTTSFDPMRDRHLWAMWRTAVNGRIVDEVRRIEQSKGQSPLNGMAQQEPQPRKQYGPSIVAPPLKRFIKLQDGSKEIAHHLSKEGKGQLQTSQFVFYGLPRVYVERLPPNEGPPK